MIHRLEYSAVIFWAVIAALFGVILAKHIEDKDFSYPLFDFAGRLKADDKDHGPEGSRTLSIQGPLRIETTSYADGYKKHKVTIAGVDLDFPSEAIANNLNKHIEALNEEKHRESIVLIALDMIGLFTAAFSSVYELLKARSAAVP